MRENRFAGGQRESVALGHAVEWTLRVAIQPLCNRAAGGVHANAQAAEGPAIIGDGNEEAGGQPVGGDDLASDERRLSAESHGADPEAVGFLPDLGFGVDPPRIGGYRTPPCKMSSFVQ